jgi:hypothetical protein
MESYFAAIATLIVLLHLDLCSTAPTTAEPSLAETRCSGEAPNWPENSDSDCNSPHLRHYIKTKGCDGVDYECILSCTEDLSKVLTLSYVCPNGKVVSGDSKNIETMKRETSQAKKCSIPVNENNSSLIKQVRPEVEH